MLAWGPLAIPWWGIPLFAVLWCTPDPWSALAPQSVWSCTGSFLATKHKIEKTHISD
jgi:hypothetical protein